MQTCQYEPKYEVYRKATTKEKETDFFVDFLVQNTA